MLPTQLSLLVKGLWSCSCNLHLPHRFPGQWAPDGYPWCTTDFPFVAWPTAEHRKMTLFSGEEWRTSSGRDLLTSNDNYSTRPSLVPTRWSFQHSSTGRIWTLPRQTTAATNHSLGMGTRLQWRWAKLLASQERKRVSFHPQQIQTRDILYKKRDFQEILIPGHFSRQPYYNYWRRYGTQFNVFSRNFRILWLCGASLGYNYSCWN